MRKELNNNEDKSGVWYTLKTPWLMFRVYLN